MTRANSLQPAFNAGELSPRLVSRTDFTKYQAGLAEAQNLIVLPEGGVTRRPGSRYVAEVKSSADKARLRRFEFSTEQAYTLEMGAGYFRFYRHQGQIVAANTDAVITNGTFDSNITGWTDQSNGTGSIAHDATNGWMDLVGAGVGNEAIAEQSVTTTTTGVEHLLRFRVVGSAIGESATVRVGSSSGGSQYLADTKARPGWHSVAFTPSASPFYLQFQNNDTGTVSIDDVSLIDDAAIEIGNPYAEADLFEVDGPQSADALFLFHNDYHPYVLTRRSNSEWSFTQLVVSDGPWLDMNDTTTTLTPSAASGSATVTASAVTGINGDRGFLSTDVGRLVRIDNPSSGINWGWGRITAVASTTSITLQIERALGGTTADTRWRLGAWSDTTGWPGTAAFFEQRLFAARTTNQPQTFWASETAGFGADYVLMSPDSANASGVWDGTVEDDDGLDYTLSAENVNTIEWMSAGDDNLAIGTAGAEWIPDADGAVLTPSDITVRARTTHGSARVAPLRVGNVALFVQRAKRKIREFGYVFESDGYQAFDMNRLTQHITAGGVVEMAYQQEPDSVVWAVRGDGVLLSMTYRREEDVVGWCRHIFGGSFGEGNAVCESVATIPGADGAGQVQSSADRDEVWVVVKRTIAGATKRYVEVLERTYETGDAQEDSYYSDSLITYDGSSTSTVSGLDHLEGETVKVYADGAIQSDKTVSSGSITLDAAASVVQVGLGYTHRGKLLKLAYGAPAGTAVGKTKRIHGVTVVVLNTQRIEIGPDSSNLVSFDFREVADAMDTASPLYTGEWFVENPGNWGSDPRLQFESDDPAPMTLLALAPELMTNDLK